MGIKRYEPNKIQWARIAPLMPGKASDPGRIGSDNPLFVNGCSWILRSGAQSCDLPQRYGKRKTVHRRFRRLCHAGVWETAFETLATNRDNTDLMNDGAVVHAHQQLATGKEPVPNLSRQEPETGRRGVPWADREPDLSEPVEGIHRLADTFGRPVRFCITPGHASDIAAVPGLLEGRQAKAVLTDKAHDGTAIHKHRNQIERCFGRLEHFRRFAIRYDRFAHLAAAMIWL